MPRRSFSSVLVSGSIALLALPACSTPSEWKVSPLLADGSSSPPPTPEPPPVAIPVGVERTVHPPSPPSAPAQEPHPSPALAWQPFLAGAWILDVSRTYPREMRGKAVLVDTTAPGVTFVTTPGNGKREGESDGLRTTTFLRRHRCHIAINAAPFSPVHLFEGRPQQIAGLHVSNGETVSRSNGKPALVISKDNQAAIHRNAKAETGVWNAVGGFGMVLEDGQVLGSESTVHPRTAAGVSRTGRYLILLVVDGRQPGFSEGATTSDVGRLLAELGAWDGINLDGGGTTTLVAARPGGRPKILNRPIHGGIPGFERVAASQLGIRLGSSP